MSYGDALSLLLNGAVVAIFTTKLAIVVRLFWRKRVEFKDLLIAVVLFSGAVALALVAWTIRFVPESALDVLRFTIAMMRVILLTAGFWLLSYWLRR